MTSPTYNMSHNQKFNKLPLNKRISKWHMIDDFRWVRRGKYTSPNEEPPLQINWVNPALISCDDTKSRQAGNQWTYEGAPQEEVGASGGGGMRGAGESSRRKLAYKSSLQPMVHWLFSKVRSVESSYPVSYQVGLPILGSQKVSPSKKTSKKTGQWAWRKNKPKPHFNCVTYLLSFSSTALQRARTHVFTINLNKTIALTLSLVNKIVYRTFVFISLFCFDRYVRHKQVRHIE